MSSKNVKNNLNGKMIGFIDLLDIVDEGLTKLDFSRFYQAKM